ncbi:radical SAM protein [Acetobacterium sp.]|jgi:biotin synthase|uniref:radical SAM protein n=1 Tax=Acetobacterium sp. TaxID=1872094 RepID=UPI000CC06DE5|nr:radical SAM protein [Acetobacterium sp.]MDO9492719.1 radical SAM protein [Acetobacterium sp.]PKM75150.1 MAG: radical SAM protein [Firmicutes bacterium HGW-Firmicutes-17]
MNTNLTKEQALAIFEKARDSRNAYELFHQASEIRDKEIGRRLWWTSGSGGIFPCMITPRCSYCTFCTDKMFPIDVLLKSLERIENLGIQQFHISGGTDLNSGYDDALLEMVHLIQARSGLKLEINLGPSFKKETVLELKKLGVDSITSSLESNSPEVFSLAKPGDSLDRRRELLQFCEDADMPSRSMMLVGLGETDRERIEHLYFLKQYNKLYQLRISRFMPFQGTAFQNKPRCSPWETALVTAMARLILPNTEISLAAGNNLDDIPLWYLAGGGNQLMGVSIAKKKPLPTVDVDVYEISENYYVVDKRKQVERILAGMQLEISNQMPDHKTILKG